MGNFAYRWSCIGKGLRQRCPLLPKFWRSPKIWGFQEIALKTLCYSQMTQNIAKSFRILSNGPKAPEIPQNSYLLFKNPRRHPNKPLKSSIFYIQFYGRVILILIQTLKHAVPSGSGPPNDRQSEFFESGHFLSVSRHVPVCWSFVQDWRLPDALFCVLLRLQHSLYGFQSRGFHVAKNIFCIPVIVICNQYFCSSRYRQLIQQSMLGIQKFAQLHENLSIETHKDYVASITIHKKGFQ